MALFKRSLCFQIAVCTLGTLQTCWAAANPTAKDQGNATRVEAREHAPACGNLNQFLLDKIPRVAKSVASYFFWNSFAHKFDHYKGESMWCNAVAEMFRHISNAETETRNRRVSMSSQDEPPLQVISIDYQNIMTSVVKDPTTKMERKPLGFNAEQFVKRVYGHLECRVGATVKYSDLDNPDDEKNGKLFQVESIFFHDRKTAIVDLSS